MMVVQGPIITLACMAQTAPTADHERIAAAALRLVQCAYFLSFSMESRTPPAPQSHMVQPGARLRWISMVVLFPQPSAMPTVTRTSALTRALMLTEVHVMMVGLVLISVPVHLAVTARTVDLVLPLGGWKRQ